MNITSPAVTTSPWRVFKPQDRAEKRWVNQLSSLPLKPNVRARTHAQLPLIRLSASLISCLFNVCQCEGTEDSNFNVKTRHIHFPSLPFPSVQAPVLGNTISRQNSWGGTGLEVPGFPWKCSVTHIHTHKWWSSVFFYNRQLLLAHDPRDNWFCLQALNHFLAPIFPHNCSLMCHYHTVTPTRCKHMKRLKDGKYYLTSSSLLATTTEWTYLHILLSEILHWTFACMTSAHLDPLIILLFFMYFNLTSKICSIKFADVSKHFHINVFQDHSRKLHLFFLDVIVPSHSVVWLAFRNWFRKFSQNFNAGHKSATHGWIMDEHPMEQGFGARPSREQRAAYLALGLDSALALHVSRDRTHSSFQHFLLCWSTSSSVFIKMIDDLMLILSTYETWGKTVFCDSSVSTYGCFHLHARRLALFSITSNSLCLALCQRTFKS